MPDGDTKIIQDSKIDQLITEPDVILNDFLNLSIDNKLEVGSLENMFEELRLKISEYISTLETQIASYDYQIQKLTNYRNQLEEYRERFTGMYEFTKRRVQNEQH